MKRAISVTLAMVAIGLFVVGFNQWLALMNEPGFHEPTTRETLIGGITLLCVPCGCAAFELWFGSFLSRIQ